MAQSVVKKSEKVNNIFSTLGVECSFEAFKDKFKEEYPADWDRIFKVYAQHELRDKKGKGHPMPKPEQYIKNMYNVGKKKFSKK